MKRINSEQSVPMYITQTYEAMQRVILASEENVALVFSAHRNLAEAFPSALKRHAGAAAMDVSALTLKSLELWDQVPGQSVLSIIRGYIQAKKMDVDCYIKVAAAVCSNAEMLIREFVDEQDQMDDVTEDDDPGDKLLLVMDTLEELVYAAGEIGYEPKFLFVSKFLRSSHISLLPFSFRHEPSLAVEKIISAQLLTHIWNADIFDDPSLTEGICRLVGAMTYTIPKPTETLWKFFEPIAAAYRINHSLLEGPLFHRPPLFFYYTSF